MATFNQAAFGQQQGGGIGPWGGAALGAAGYGAINVVQEIGKKAVIGEISGLASVGMNVLAGNQALSYANQAMTSANAVSVTGTTLATNDLYNIRTALQQLAQGQQAQSWTGYLGISSSNQASASPTSQAPAQSQNLAGLFVIVLIVFLLMK